MSDIRRSLYFSVHISKLQLVRTDKLNNGNIPPISVKKCWIWWISRWGIVNQLLNSKLRQRRLSLGSGRGRETPEALAKALAMRSIRERNVWEAKGIAS